MNFRRAEGAPHTIFAGWDRKGNQSQAATPEVGAGGLEGARPFFAEPTIATQA
jgi:hypothetical protein